MSQTQIYEKEWEDHEKPPNQKQRKVYETQPNQKEDWIQTLTQLYQNQWKEHEKKDESRQKAKNGEPIVVTNHLNYKECDIQAMVDQVLTKNEFSDESSIFVVVPSVDNNVENSSDSQTSTICIQMSLNSAKWKTKVDPVENDPNQCRNGTAARRGVKMSAKGNRFFMGGIPIQILSFHNKKTLFKHGQPNPKVNEKKATKNKLCQFITPTGIVEKIERNVVSTDTTDDRPCCCNPNTTLYSDCNQNDRYVATVLSRLVTPLLERGIIRNPFHIRWGMKQQESVMSVTVPLSPGSKLPCRLHNHAQAPDQCLGNHALNSGKPARCSADPTQYHAKAPAQCSADPTQYHAKAPAQCSADPIQYHAEAPAQCCADPTQYHAKAPAQCSADPTQYHAKAPAQCSADPTQYHAKASAQCFADPTQYHAEAPAQCSADPTQYDAKAPKQYPANSAQHHAESSSAQKRTNLSQMQPCQCGPEVMLELLKLAVKEGKMQHMQSVGCGGGPEPPKAQAPEPPPAAQSPIPERMQIEMGETKRKQVCIKETKFSSTVGTSTEPKLFRKCKNEKKSHTNIICKCPQREPGTEQNLEPYVILGPCYQNNEFEETMKKNSLEALRVSGFKIIQKKRPPQIQPEYTIEDALRYYAMTNPELFKSIMAEQQAKMDNPEWTPPSSPGNNSGLETTPSDSQDEEGQFRGLKFKIGGKGSGSQGLGGICCFDLVQESFTTW